MTMTGFVFSVLFLVYIQAPKSNKSSLKYIVFAWLGTLEKHLQFFMTGSNDKALVAAKFGHLLPIPTNLIGRPEAPKMRA